MLEVYSGSDGSAAILEPAQSENIVERCLAVWRSVGLSEKPSVEWFPRKVVPFSAVYSKLFDTAVASDPDAVVLAEQRRSAPLHNLRDHIPLSLLPVIDIGGRAKHFADVHFDLMDQASWIETARCILEFRGRREGLSPFVRASLDPQTRLLAQAFVSARQLTPIRCAETTGGICYPGFPSAEHTVPLAESLCRQHYMKRTFFDRLHECARCGSRRLSVREECNACRSPELRQASLIHHYRCATLRPEAEFRQGNLLICPKCSVQLRNYGKDYDKPGQTQICSDCNRTTSEPAVGFVCLDCSTHADGDTVKRADVHAYALTAEAVAALTKPVDSFAIKGLPQALVADLRQLQAMQATAGSNLAVAEVRYGARQSITQARGEPVFERLRALFLENLANFLAGRGTIYPGETADYLLLDDTGERVGTDIDRLLAQGQNSLSEDLSPRIRLATSFKRALP